MEKSKYEKCNKIFCLQWKDLKKQNGPKKKYNRTENFQLHLQKDLIKNTNDFFHSCKIQFEKKKSERKNKNFRVWVFGKSTQRAAEAMRRACCHLLDGPSVFQSSAPRLIQTVILREGKRGTAKVSPTAWRHNLSVSALPPTGTLLKVFFCTRSKSKPR